MNANLANDKIYRHAILFRRSPPVGFSPHEGLFSLREGFPGRRFLIFLKDFFVKSNLGTNADPMVSKTSKRPRPRTNVPDLLKNFPTLRAVPQNQFVIGGPELRSFAMVASADGCPNDAAGKGFDSLEVIGKARIDGGGKVFEALPRIIRQRAAPNLVMNDVRSDFGEGPLVAIPR